MAKTNAKKKAPAKKTAKAVIAPKPAKITAASKARSKSEVYGILAEHNGLTRKQVAGVFETLTQILGADLSKSGPGVLNVGGLMKVVAKRLPATKARPGKNPATGEEIMIKAKPARTVVRVRALKSLKSLV